ncbi:hypothetical protein KAI92_00150 [Candidatus Parcubacteria bacterium]|nr:hypothetical protein [Candidatus Parcubacteria bacterium]
MKKLIGFLIVIGVLLNCGISFGYIFPTVHIEGKDLVTYEQTEKKRYEGLFSGNVKSGELSKATALNLASGALDSHIEYDDTELSVVTKILYWNFPIKTETETSGSKYFIENGKISKIKAISKKEIKRNVEIELLYRTLPMTIILLITLLNTINKIKSYKLIIFYLCLISSIILTAFTNLGFGLFFAMFLCLISIYHASHNRFDADAFFITFVCTCTSTGTISSVIACLMKNNSYNNLAVIENIALMSIMCTVSFCFFKIVIPKFKKEKKEILEVM